MGIDATDILLNNAWTLDAPFTVIVAGAIVSKVITLLLLEYTNWFANEAQLMNLSI